MGFAAREDDDSNERVSELVMAEVKRTFNPEFINRIDEIIVFDALTDEDLVRITLLLIGQLNRNLVEKGIEVALTRAGVDWLLRRTLQDRSYGARPLRRAIQRHIEDPLSEAFIRGQIRPRQPIEVDVRDGGLWYSQAGQEGALSA
jgi:ATP-dependent Clp protease ATP-binding subunit ClpC